MSLVRNHIAATIGQSAYAGAHLLLLVDGEPLDALLDRLAPGRELKGLVPTLLGCESQTESSTVHARIVPASGVTTLAPVLMCPDDRDFSCTLVIAEVTGGDDFVEWRRLGLDITAGDAPPELVGAQVEWFHGVGPFRFARIEYVNAVRVFQSTAG